MIVPTRTLRIAAAAASGSLLFLSDFPTHAWPLQAVALVPWLWALSPPARREASSSQSWLDTGLDAGLAGLALGLFSTLPLLAVTAFPWPMALGLGLYVTAIWVALSIFVARVLRWPGLWGAFGASACAVVAEWITTHAVPVWGTAQSFVRVWSAAPWAIQFVDLTGTLGIVFVLVAAQALLVRIATGTPRRRAHVVALVLLLASVGAYDVLRWREAPTGTLRVAAVGWTDERLPQGRGTSDRQLVREVLLPLFERAVAQNAALIVSPETGFSVSEHTRDALFAPLVSFAHQHLVALAVGYFDTTHDDNRIALIDATGKRHEAYRKTHLIPLLESYRPGDGSIVTLPVHGLRVGGMICQDDNFTDIASAYGRHRYRVVAVPTNDWRAIKDYHFENSRMRALENRYAVVRGATGGISAIVSARGEVLAERDPFQQGPGVVVADLPLLRPGSLFSWTRHGFAALCGAFLLLAGWRSRR